MLSAVAEGTGRGSCGGFDSGLALALAVAPLGQRSECFWTIALREVVLEKADCSCIHISR